MMGKGGGSSSLVPLVRYPSVVAVTLSVDGTVVAAIYSDKTLVVRDLAPLLAPKIAHTDPLALVVAGHA